MVSRYPSLLFVAISVLSAAGHGPFEVAIQVDTLSPWNIVPGFDNEHILVYGNHEVALYGADGSLAYAIPSGNKASIVNVAVDADGSAAAALRRSPTGGGKGSIVLFAPNGARKFAIETESWLPSFVAFASDHTIWAIGFQDPGDESQAYFVLRHFSPDGRDLGGFLPRSSFQTGVNPNPAHEVVGLSALRVTNGRVGALLNRSRERALWVETDLNGKELGRYDIPFDFSSVVPHPNGNVYLQGLDSSVLVLDRSSGTWNRTSVSASGKLLGADQHYLIFQVGRTTTVRWVPVESEESGPF